MADRLHEWDAESLPDVIFMCWQIAEDHGFHDLIIHTGATRTFGDTIALIHSEISEAYEAFRHRGSFGGWVEVDGKPEGAPVELIDAVIRIFDTLQGECGLSLPEIIHLMEHKMQYNMRRPYKHGKVI